MFSIISVSVFPPDFSVVRIIMSCVMFEPLKYREAYAIAFTDATRLSTASDVYFFLSSASTEIRKALS